MTAVTLILAALAGLLHVMLFVFESLWWSRETIGRPFGVASQAALLTVLVGALT